MASYYVRSAAAGAGTGADWANAYLTLAAALSGKAAGDTFYVSEDHAESTSGSITLTSPGTLANPCKIICVSHTGSVPPVSADLSTAGQISTTATGAINVAGSAFYRGIIFNVGSSGAPVFQTNATSSTSQVFRNCRVNLISTGSVQFAGTGGNSSCFCLFDNTQLNFSNAAASTTVNCDFRWTNTSSPLPGFAPTTLFSFSAARGANIECTGVDFSAVTGTLVGSGSQTATRIRLVDCKLNASVTPAATPSSPGTSEVDLIRCASDSTNYRHGRYTYAGSQIEETTIVRTGGASDGTTPLAQKIATTANASLIFPYISLPIVIWNDTVGSSVTATVECIWGGGAVPNNDDIWAEVEYLGSSGSPLASFISNGKADILASNAALSAGSGTWGGSTTKFKLAVTFTPQQKGWLFFRVKAAKVSSTFYIDPKVVLT